MSTAIDNVEFKFFIRHESSKQNFSSDNFC